MTENQELNTSISTTSPEFLLINQMATIDGWRFDSSDFFPESFRIVKKRKGDTPISIHFDPQRNRFLKLAERNSWNTLIDKEAEGWKIALDVFGIKEEIKKGTVVREGKKLTYLDMPNMGIPLKYFEAISPHVLTREVVDGFMENLHAIVKDHHVYFSDLNAGNILVRIENGKYKLFAIDWESYSKIKEGEVEDCIRTQIKKCYTTFGKFYPDQYV